MDYFHSNREEQIYICNICNKEYTWRKSLMKHYRDIHQMRNTPALAEINRQLAALASAKVRNAVANLPIGSDTPPQGDTSSSLQSYVSIANFTNRKHHSSKNSSDASEKSNKSESEMDNDNTNDAIGSVDDMMMMDDYHCGNDDLEMDGSVTNDGPDGDTLSMTNDNDEQPMIIKLKKSASNDDDDDDNNHEKMNNNNKSNGDSSPLPPSSPMVNDDNDDEKDSTKNVSKNLENHNSPASSSSSSHS
ncbi:abrupt-like protein [Euroglyphus maynei]|uniref:Abrupt-like protein n=1 Tax=Euroglyphus maynei TaxID=6958 RepID=A0A1Y3B5G1_EURMA|nr:abrupt-like protein [Euroglyphus maynei]